MFANVGERPPGSLAKVGLAVATGSRDDSGDGSRDTVRTSVDPLEPTLVEQPRLGPLQGSLFGLATEQSDQPGAKQLTAAPLRADREAALAEALNERIVRHQLDPCCWVDVAQNWFAGADDLLVTLLDQLTWTCGRRLMYGTFHDEPRLSATAHVDDLHLPTLVASLAGALTTHYFAGRAGTRDRHRCERIGPASTDRDRFDAIFCNYYRDGHDSVAWHADRVGRRQVDPLVAIACLGGPRPFRVRPMSGGNSTTFMLGSGDLLVMGGAMQHHWEHSVPKLRYAPPRMSVTLRSGPGAERA